MQMPSSLSNNSMQTLPILLAAALGNLAAASTTTPVPLSCPESVPISMSPMPGWKTHVASDLYLNSATPIDGPPEMHGDLADYTSKPGKKEWSYTYDLDRNFPDGKWLECGYGPHNELTLSQRMPDSIKICTFTYHKGAKMGQNDIKILCR
jgi:hypothetical protein